MLGVALRGGAIALLVLIAGLLVREYGRISAARLGAAFAIGVASYAICFAPHFADHLELWRAPFIGVCSGNAAVFWLFSRALFDDGFEFRWRHAALWATLTAVGILRIFVLAPVGSPLSEPLGVALSLASAGFAGLAVAQSVRGWGADLVEGRRRLRPYVVGGVAGYIAIIAGAEVALRGSPPPLAASAMNAAGLAAFSALIAWWALRVAGAELFHEPAAASPQSLLGAPLRSGRTRRTQGFSRRSSSS